MRRHYHGMPDWRASILYDYLIAGAVMAAAVAAILYFWGP